jgi:hypothetical protein
MPWAQALPAKVFGLRGPMKVMLRSEVIFSSRVVMGEENLRGVGFGGVHAAETTSRGGGKPG